MPSAHSEVGMHDYGKGHNPDFFVNIEIYLII